MYNVDHFQVLRELDGARYVYFHEDELVVYAWFGGCRIYVYDAYTGQEYDGWGYMYDLDLNGAIDSVNEHVRDLPDDVDEE